MHSHCSCLAPRRAPEPVKPHSFKQVARYCHYAGELGVGAPSISRIFILRDVQIPTCSSRKTETRQRSKITKQKTLAILPSILDRVPSAHRSRTCATVVTGSRSSEARDHSPAAPKNFMRGRARLASCARCPVELRCPLPRPLAAGQNTSETTRTDQIKCRPSGRRWLESKNTLFEGGGDCFRNGSRLFETVSRPMQGCRT